MSKKPVILFFQFDLMSHIFRSLRLAKVLNNTYDVYMRESEKYSKYIENSGVKEFKCIDFDPETSVKKLGEYDFSWLNEKNLEKIFLAQVDVINKYKPDIVIGDTSFSLKMAAEQTGVKYISILNGYFTKYYKLTRELSLSHPISKYISRLPKGILNPIVRYKEAENFMLILKEFNKVRAKYSLSGTDNYLDEIEGNSNIICDLPEIFPQKNLPENYHFIGPLFYENRISNGVDKKSIDSNKKTILVSLGSSSDWDRFKFLNDNEFSKYNIIIAGNNHNILHAPFLIKTSFVNFNELHSILDLVICHGGNGTLSNSLVHKIPVLCLPLQPEQHWNTQRIGKMGYGQSIETIKLKRIIKVIEKWIDMKTEIKWELNFNKFNNSFQNNLIHEIIENNLN